MLVKIATFFLIGMVILAMFGRLRWPGGAARTGQPKKPQKCKSCGAFRIGKGPCPCGKA